MARFGRSYPQWCQHPRPLPGVPPTVQVTGTAGIANGFATSLNTTMTVTAGSDPKRYALMGVAYRHGGQTYASQTSTVTYNGVAMNLVLGQAYSTEMALEIWELFLPASASSTVSITQGNGSFTGREIAAVLTVFNGVKSRSSTIVTNSGTGTSVTCSVAPTASELPVLAVAEAQVQSISAGSGMTLLGGIGSGGASAASALLDAPNSVTSMLATIGGSFPWQAATVRLSG